MINGINHLRSEAEKALTVCRERHLTLSHSYNFSPCRATVSRVGVEIDENLNVLYFVEIDEASCSKLNADISSLVSESTGVPVAVRSEW